MTLELCMTCITFYESLPKNEKIFDQKFVTFLVLISLHVAIIISSKSDRSEKNPNHEQLVMGEVKHFSLQNLKCNKFERILGCWLDYIKGITLYSFIILIIH